MSIDSIEKYFKKNKQDGTIGHAYLFSNVNYFSIREEIDQIINKYFFETKAELINNPDFYLLEPEKGTIKKEKILELEQEIIKTSQSNNKKVYIINQCEKMNSFAANSLLKTLEEPMPNVYAILFTESVERVFPTIKSRCQLIYCDGHQKNEINEDITSKAIAIIKKLEKDKERNIAYNNKMFYKSFDKEELKKILNVIEYFYKDCINELNNLKLEYFEDRKEMIDEILINNKEEMIIKKIVLINKNLSLLEYNLNLNSFVDKLLIEFGRI